jgi:hypothetical protein
MLLPLRVCPFDQDAYGNLGQGRHTSQHAYGGTLEQTLTQQHFAASTCDAEIIVNPPHRMVNRANNSTIALKAFIVLIRNYLLS